MPIYEYQCKECNEVFETITSTNSSEKVTCTKCGSDQLQKLISQIGKKISGPGAETQTCIPRGGFS